jgi:hypothetical protein
MEIVRRTGASKTGLWHQHKCFMTDPVPGLLSDKTPPPRIPLPEPEVAFRAVYAMLADLSGDTTRWTAVTTTKAQGIGVSAAQHFWRKHGPQLHRTP